MFESLRSVAEQLPQRKRKQLLWLFLLALLGAAGELATLGAVIPFLGTIANPEAASSYSLLQPLLNGRSWDEQVLITTSVFVGVVLAAGIVRLILSYATQRYAFGVGHDLGQKIVDSTLSAPYEIHQARNSSDVIAGVNKVQIVVLNVFLPLLQACVSLVIGLFIVFALLWMSPLVVASGAAFFVIVYYLASRPIQPILVRNSEVSTAVYAQRIRTVQEALRGIREVKLYDLHSFFLNRFAEDDLKLRRAQASSAFLGGAPKYVLETTGTIALAIMALVTVLAYGELGKALTILGVLVVGSARLLPLMQNVYYGWSQAVSNQHFVSDVLTLARPVNKSDVGGVAVTFVRDLKFEDVSFAYPGAACTVLNGLSVKICRGDFVGIVGPTGSGKSTVMDLMLGLLHPTTGRIVVDDLELTSARLPGWRSLIAHVPQDIFLSDASIRENIAFGCQPDQIDDAAVTAAAERAQLARFVEDLPRGYATTVGENGVRLSGGQRQRIGLARAFYRKAEVLVLDEATSALDTYTETNLMDVVATLRGEMTVVMITHRETALRGCDLKISLPQGANAPQDIGLHRG